MKEKIIKIPNKIQFKIEKEELMEVIFEYMKTKIPYAKSRINDCKPESFYEDPMNKFYDDGKIIYILNCKGNDKEFLMNEK